MRELTTTIECELADVRGLQSSRPELYRDTDYSASQAFGVSLRFGTSGALENGVVFDSVRRSGGTNLCIFWPSRVPLPIVQAGHFEYQWNAGGDVSVAKLTSVAM
jgi:RES domain